MPDAAASRPRVLFAWRVADALRARLTRALADGGTAELVFPGDPTDERLMAAVVHADAIVGWRVPEAVLRAAPRLRVLINPGAGVQAVVPVLRAVNADRAEPIALVNGHGNAAFTAQGAVALLLALANRVVAHDRWLRAGRWRTGDAEGASVPLGGRTIGLLGYGAVNRRVHRLLAGFDARFLALRRHPERGDAPSAPRHGLPTGPPPTEVAWFGPDALDAFLDASDVVVAALPLTDATRGLLGAAELARIGPNGVLVNVARGAIVDEAALYAALATGALGGAALDVWWRDDPTPDGDGRRWPYDAARHPFHALDNVVLSPHRAASPYGDLGRWDEVIENVRRLAQGEELLNVVDLEAGY